MGDLLTEISTAFGGPTVSEVTLSDGKIKLLDADSGYSRTDMRLEYNGAGTFEMPKYFEIIEAGGELVSKANVTIYDSLGVTHVGQVSFVRTDAGDNSWDMVLNSLSGDVELLDRRVNDISFFTDGSYGGLGGTDTSSLQLRYGYDPTNTRTIGLDMGTVGQYDGISLSEGSSTVAIVSQNGYELGWLSSMEVRWDALMIGRFTNGVQAEIAEIAVVVIPEPATLSLLLLGGLALSTRSRLSLLRRGHPA